MVDLPDLPDRSQPQYQRLAELGGVERQHRGINIQRPWAGLILDGIKSIEARTYPLKGYGKETLWIIETPGKRPLSEKTGEELATILEQDEVLPCRSVGGTPYGHDDFAPARARWRRCGARRATPVKARIVGTVEFISCKQYHTYEEWRGDAMRHRVPKNSAFDWQSGKMYSWEIGSVKRLVEPQPGPVSKGMIGSRPVTRMALFTT
jgi:hypothetical protein